jgi:L-malate glycosyltransferase
MEKKRRILFVHLLNDYSGSPLVLSQIISEMKKKGHECHVFTNTLESGHLANIEGVEYHTFFYRWSKYKFLTLLLLLISQLVLFFKVLLKLKKDSIVYVNTVLPFGAALAGKCYKTTVIYHIHETSITPKLLKKTLFAIANFTADHTIYVSNYLFHQEKLPNPRNHVVHNALSKTFLNLALKAPAQKPDTFTLLMLCSLKNYKGIWEFYGLAQKLSQFNFCLVTNASEKDVNTFFSKVSLPPNLQIHPVQHNVHPFYAKSHLVVNLSHPDKWRETFGMTVIEGMAYGIPSLVPPVGGIAELVEESVNGFKIACFETDKLVECIKTCATNPTLYESLSKNASRKVQLYAEDTFAAQIDLIIRNS